MSDDLSNPDYLGLVIAGYVLDEQEDRSVIKWAIQSQTQLSGADKSAGNRNMLGYDVSRVEIVGGNVIGHADKARWLVRGTNLNTGAAGESGSTFVDGNSEASLSLEDARVRSSSLIANWNIGVGGDGYTSS